LENESPARLARAVRQTVAMERRLGAHADHFSRQQQAKLFAVSNAGAALVGRPESRRNPFPLPQAGERFGEAAGVCVDPIGGLASSGRAGSSVAERPPEAACA